MIRKLDIAFFVAIVAVAIVLGSAILLSKRTINMDFYYQDQRTAVPMPEWTRYKEAGVSA